MPSFSWAQAIESSAGHESPPAIRPSGLPHSRSIVLADERLAGTGRSTRAVRRAGPRKRDLRVSAASGTSSARLAPTTPGATSSRHRRPTRFVRRDVERVAQLVRDHDRRHGLEIAELDDLVVDRRRGDRIEPGRRLVVEQRLAAWRSSPARWRRAAAGRPTAPTASGRRTPRARRSPAPRPRARPLRRAAGAFPRTAGSRRSRARSANRTARLPGTPCRGRRARPSALARTTRRPGGR